MPRKWLLCLAVAVLAPLACDFPTESDDETQVSTVQNVTAASTAGTVSTLTLTAGASKLQIGKTTTLTYRVVYNRADASEPLPTQLGLTTSLGNFGQAAGGPTSSTPALNFPSSCSSCEASGQLSFYAGTTTGTASVVASVGGTTTTASITIATATSLFINSISPTFGASSGGTPVTITGQGFPASDDPAPRVNFGTTLAQFVSSSETQVVVNAPQSPSPVSTGSSLVVDITVDVPATDVTAAQTDTLKGAFTYTAGGGAPPKQPSIQRIVNQDTQTNAGDNAGGYQVVIFGNNFIAPVTLKIGSGSSVSTFSGVAIDSSLVDVVNAAQINVSNWPPATQDQLNTSVDILLQNDGSGIATVAENAFSYQSPDVVLNASPTSVIYYDASNADKTTVTITARGLDISSSSFPSDLNTNRYKLEIGGEEQCQGSGDCKVTSFSTAQNSYTLEVSPLTAVTPSSCADQTGPVMFTDLLTTETASGPTFSYEVDKPTITSLSTPTTPCASGTSSPCDSESGGNTLTIDGTFSTTELDNGQVLINGQSASFMSNCQASPSSCTLTVTVPAFTGSFDTASCTSGTSTGTMKQPKKVDVEVLYQTTTCSVTRSQALTYDPLDSSCQVSTSAPTAGFSAVVVTSDPLMVQLIDQSSGASSVEWFFGDGNTFTCPGDQDLPCSTTHAYSTANFYTVTQQVRNSVGSDTATQTVKAGEAPSASITVKSDGVTGTTVTAINNSTGIDSGTTCEWDWGDGSTVDTGCGQGIPPGQDHVYSAAGTYTIVFKATNGLGTDSTTAQIEITDP